MFQWPDITWNEAGSWWVGGASKDSPVNTVAQGLNPSSRSLPAIIRGSWMGNGPSQMGSQHCRWRSILLICHPYAYSAHFSQMEKKIKIIIKHSVSTGCGYRRRAFTFHEQQYFLIHIKYLVNRMRYLLKRSPSILCYMLSSKWAPFFKVTSHCFKNNHCYNSWWILYKYRDFLNYQRIFFMELFIFHLVLATFVCF